MYKYIKRTDVDCKFLMPGMYFYPLISEFNTYRRCQGADKANLPNAHKMADSVICLPMHHILSKDDINRTLDLIIK